MTDLDPHSYAEGYIDGMEAALRVSIGELAEGMCPGDEYSGPIEPQWQAFAQESISRIEDWKKSSLFSKTITALAFFFGGRN